MTVPDPGPLMALATGYWGSQALLTAVELGVFARLARGPASAEDLARDLGTRAHPTLLLLRALTALGLLQIHERGFANHPDTNAFLDPASPSYLGEALRYSRDMYQAWGELDTALRQDEPVVGNDEYLGQDEQRTRRFVRSMHGRALGVGQALVAMVDLSGRRRLLDLGGGPGTYSALFTRRHPELEATLIELPAVADLAGEILAEMGASNRVKVIGGDFHNTEWPAANDVVLISGVLHRERAADARRLIGRAHDSLAGDGLLVVSDVFTDAGGIGPAFANLFGLNMLLSAPGGGVHADTDVAAWLRDAGFTAVAIRPFPAPMPHRVILAHKPAS